MNMSGRGYIAPDNRSHSRVSRSASWPYQTTHAHRVAPWGTIANRDATMNPSTRAGAMRWDGHAIALASKRQNRYQPTEREEEGPQKSPGGYIERRVRRRGHRVGRRMRTTKTAMAPPPHCYRDAREKVGRRSFHHRAFVLLLHLVASTALRRMVVWSGRPISSSSCQQ
jgi:hypothetical protein